MRLSGLLAFQTGISSYMHRDGGGCVSGAAFVPEGIWPEEYKFLFADFIFREAYSLTEVPENECRTCTPPVSRFQNETFFKSTIIPGKGHNQGRIVDMFFAPYNDTQVLYIITFQHSESLIRVRYTGIHDDLPIANFTASKQDVDVNETIQFDSSGSYDPEGEDISFQWFFGDDTKSTEGNPVHSYNKPGEYRVTLFVTDALNQRQEKSMSIIVGDPPEAEILSPSEGEEFYVGQIFRLEGKANYLNGTVFNDSQLEWEVRKHHDDHYHPFLDRTFGNNIDISPAPEPEDFYASTNSYLEVILYATDENGLTRKISRNIQPSLVDVTIDSNKDGLNIEVNDERISTSSNVVMWKDQHVQLKATSDSSYRFESWSDGVEEEIRSVVVNTSNPVFTANFCALDGSACSDQVPCCTGYCVRSAMDNIAAFLITSSLRNNSNKADKQQLPEIAMVCMDNPPPTESPTVPTTRAPTATRTANSTATPVNSSATLDSSATESGATIFKHIDSFLLVASVAFVFFANA